VVAVGLVLPPPPPPVAVDVVAGALCSFLVPLDGAMLTKILPDDTVAYNSKKNGLEWSKFKGDHLITNNAAPQKRFCSPPLSAWFRIVYQVDLMLASVAGGC